MAAPDGKENAPAVTRTLQSKRAKANNTASGIGPKTKTAIRQPKTGRLSQLMSIPMDVLMEIFGHLHPLDLLHLARTTKAFRRVLTHRSSLFVWKAALSTVSGLPDCPPELSEPQWANLAFDTHCSLCLRPNIRTIFWSLRVRLCTACAKLHITNYWYEFYLGQDDSDNMTSAVPNRRGKRGPEFLRDEYQKVYAQYLAIENLEARQAFFMERKQLVKRIKEHAKLCVAWAGARAVARSDELVHLKSSRHQAIVDKLVALAWGEEIDEIPCGHALTNHKLVKVPQLLTDRIWANISGTMIEYMEKMKTNRLARELAQLRTQRKVYAIDLFRAYKAECAPFTDVMPEPLDFHAFGPIKEILDQPSDINVDSESFLHLMPELDGVVEEWRRIILKKFIKEVKVGVVKRSDILDDNPLDLDAPNESILQRIQLASTVFACIPCTNLQGFDTMLDLLRSSHCVPFYFPTKSQSPHTRPLWFPRVLGHRCMTKSRGHDLSDAATKLSVLICHRQRWSCDSVITVDQEACEAAVAIIEACEMDPRTATVDDMDQLDARLECLTCLVPNVAREETIHIAFGWRSAVKHQREYHPSDPGDWRMLTAGEAEVARVHESVLGNIAQKAWVPSDRTVWLCLYCLDGPDEESWMTLKDIESHLQLSHGVVVPEVDYDYVKDFAAPELYATHTLFEATMVKFPE